MLNIFVYQNKFPINTKLVDDLILIESKYEGSFCINIVHSKQELNNILNKGINVDILFFNEICNINIIYENINVVKKQNVDVLYIFPLLYANALLENLYQIGSTTFISDCIDTEKIESLLLYKKTNDSRNTHFICKNRRRVISIPYSNIQYFEGEKRYVHIITNSGGIETFIGKTSEVYESILKTTYTFVRIHQSYIVNLDYVKIITSKSIILKSDIHIPISKKYLKQVYQTMALYCDNNLKTI